MNDAHSPIVGVLLAAGRGTRFHPGLPGAKLLAPFPPSSPQAEPLLLAAARALRAALDPARDPVLVVMRPPAGAQDDALRERLRAIGCTVLSSASVDDGTDGMGRSIALGVAASAGAAGWIIALGDMPRVRADSIAAVRAALRDGAVTAAPFHRGQRGHPVGFAAACGAELIALDGDEGARAVLARHPPWRVEVDDPGVLFDVDRREDLAGG